ncbi:lipase family protein [Rhodococcus sp. G-MC3]|uniref:alpha/beta hydrolase family protein n=1 Tax=Rhodococcus sp. G-MC3 TaxID=3046209 RepID=UPI0024B8D249|nr:lipase family protein [Rhodococcus sp. G-MC3]MDJ0396411.1 lipase family protein [Rhodococcus sp. G-MC3]
MDEPEPGLRRTAESGRSGGVGPGRGQWPTVRPQGSPRTSDSTSPAHAVALQLNVFRGLLAAYPELQASAMATPAGEEALVGAGTQCVNHLAYVLESNIDDPAATLLQPTPPPADWQRRLDENTAGYVPATAPVLVMQGTADTVVNPNGTTQYISRACGFAGSSVEYTVYQDATHQTIPKDAKPEYLGWIADRFTGDTAPSNCPAPGTPYAPPAPIPTPAPLIPAPSAQNSSTTPAATATPSPTP